MSIERVLITGGKGALGRALTAEFEALDITCRAFGRDELDASNMWDVEAFVGAARPSLVIACAAWTDVAGCERDHERARVSNTHTALAAAYACSRRHVPLLYISSDYAAPAGDGLHLWYSTTKSDGEKLMRCPLARFHRMALLDPSKARGYTWLNGASVANREWTDDAARRLVQSLVEMAPFEPPIVRSAPPPPRTVADMVRDRWPDHPALEHVVTDPDELNRLCGYRVPLDTRTVR